MCLSKISDLYLLDERKTAGKKLKTPSLLSRALVCQTTIVDRSRKQQKGKSLSLSFSMQKILSPLNILEIQSKPLGFRNAQIVSLDTTFL